MEEKLSRKHVLNMIDRERMSMTGVTDVFSFDEDMIELETVEGYIEIKGSGLHIVKMNLDEGELIVNGNISEITYHDQVATKKKGSMLSKLFK